MLKININKHSVRDHVSPTLGLASLFVAIACFFIAYAQLYGESSDYARYETFFRMLRQNPDLDTRFEIGFVFLSRAFVWLISDNSIVYALIVGAAVFSKMHLLSRYSTNLLVFLFCSIVFLLRFLPHHELTQLRLSVSLVFLLAAYVFFDMRSWVKFSLACFFAVLFHNSAILCVPVFFIRTDKRWVAMAVVGAVYAVVAVGVDIVYRALGDFLSVVSIYDEEGFGDDLRPFSATILLDLFMISFGVANWKKISSSMKHVLMFQMVGLAIFYGAFDFGVIAQRGREYFTVLWLVYIAQAFRCDRVVSISAVVFGVFSMVLYTYIFIFSGSFSQGV